jgi:hypothetical protein
MKRAKNTLLMITRGSALWRPDGRIRGWWRVRRGARFLDSDGHRRCAIWSDSVVLPFPSFKGRRSLSLQGSSLSASVRLKADDGPSLE